MCELWTFLSMITSHLSTCYSLVHSIHTTVYINRYFCSGIHLQYFCYFRFSSPRWWSATSTRWGAFFPHIFRVTMKLKNNFIRWFHNFFDLIFERVSFWPKINFFLEIIFLGLAESTAKLWACQNSRTRKKSTHPIKHLYKKKPYNLKILKQCNCLVQLAIAFFS